MTFQYASSTEEFYDYFTESTTLPEFTVLPNITGNITGNLTTLQRAYSLIIPVVGLLVITLNCIVIVSSGLILNRNVQPRTTYLFLGNIALCDLVTGLTVVFGSVYPKNLRSELFCGVQLGLIVASTLSSVWSVGLVAVDRFLFIIHGINYTQWVYGRRTRLLILSTWVFVMIVGFLPIMGWSEDSTNHGKRCWLVLLVPKHLLTIIVILGWIPLLMNGILYLIILGFAIKRAIKLKEADEKGSSTVNNLRISRGIQKGNTKKKSENSSQWKAIKVVAFTTGAYMVTWGPYTVACFLYIFCTNPATCKTLAHMIASPLAILGFFNSLLNPIIYAWWHKPFRSNVKNLVCKKRPSTGYRKSTSKSTATTSSGTRNPSVSQTASDLDVTHL